MTFIKKHFLLLPLAVLMNSCDSAIEIDSSRFEKKLVVNCMVENGECNLILYSNKSNSSDNTFDHITKANCLLNEHKITEDNGNYIFDFPEFLTTNILQLNVSREGYPPANSVATIPSVPAFEIMDTTWITDKKYFWGQKHLQINIKINDVKKAISDYYFIELNAIWYANDANYDSNLGMWIEKRKRYKEKQTFYIEDNAAEIVSNGGIDFRLNKTEFTLNDDKVYPQAIILSDKTFDGKNKTITLHCQLSSLKGRCAEIKVSAINSGYYEFIQSIAAYNFNNTMFNDPVRIKSNINGGLGYFGIKVTATDSIKIND